MNAAVALTLALVAAYVVTLGWIWDSWWLIDSYYTHGPLVAALLALVVWRRRAVWRALPARPDARAWWLLGPGLLVHLAGASLTIDSLSALSLLLVVPGAVWLAAGRARLLALSTALALLVFAIPMPMFVTGKVAFELKEVATTAGLWLGNLLGLGAQRVGAEIVIPGQAQRLLVAAPCSGLRSLVALATLGYCVAFFLGRQDGARRWIVLSLSVPIALVSNIVRIAVLCALARWQGVGFASGLGHDLVGGAVWLLDLGLLLLADVWLSRGLPRGARALASTASAPSAGPPLRAPARLWPHVAVVCCVAPLLASLTAYRPVPESRGRAAAIGDRVGPYELVQTYPLDASYYRQLGTEDAAWRGYRAPDGGPLFLVAVFHDENWKSLHPPHICLRGSHMEITGDDAVEVEVGARRVEVGRIRARSDDNGDDYLSLYAYVAPGLVTGSYARFFLHHAPRALLRRPVRGCLVRAETWVEAGDGGPQRAHERCAGFLREFLPRIEALLR